MSTAARPTVRVTHRFTQSPERVFDAWLDPATASRFLFTDASGQIVRCEIDARVGGGFAIVDRRSEMGDVLHEGEYLEIDRPRRLVFTFRVPKYSQDTDIVTIDIAPLAEGCELTLTHEFKPMAEFPRESVIQGWTGILAGLERTLG